MNPSGRYTSQFTLSASRATSHVLFAIAVFTRPLRYPCCCSVATGRRVVARCLGIAFRHSLCRDDADHRTPRLRSPTLVNHRRHTLLAAAYGISGLARAKLNGNYIVSVPLALVGVLLWLGACSIGPLCTAEARATVMAAIGMVARCLLCGTSAWTWRWRVALANHGAASWSCRVNPDTFRSPAPGSIPIRPT